MPKGKGAKNPDHPIINNFSVWTKPYKCHISTKLKSLFYKR